MNDVRDIERLLADWMTATAPSHAPREAVDEAIATTNPRRPRPTWLALMRTPPMTTQRRATVGAPTLRLAYLTGLLLLAIAIVGAGIGVGAQLVVRAEEPTAANGLIAFDAEGDIWLANADGSDVRRITADPAEERGPIWSRDGSRLAFMVDRGDGRTDLVTTDAEGGDRILVAASVAVPSLQHQSWSPDGLRLTYSAMVEGGRNNIFVAEADGSGPVQVGDPTLTAKEPAWSPDGRSIAFHGGTSSVEPTDPSGPAKRGVYVMDADGSNIRLVSQVVGSGGFAFSMPLWSPDGSRIVTYVGSENSHDIWVFDADGGEERNVSNSVGDDSWPTWAPDGERIAFDHFETRARVALVDAEGSQPFVLEDPRITNWEPVWSPDGTRFVVHLGPQPGEDLGIVDPGGEAHTVVIPATAPGQVSWQAIRS
jgi:TolB protein